MANVEQASSNEVLTLPFAVDSETGAPLPEGLEVLLAWLLITKRASPPQAIKNNRNGIDALAKAYLPFWAVTLGGRVALIDPLADRSAKIEFREPTRIDGFADRLQSTHRKFSMFRNMLQAYQNTFLVSNQTRSVEIAGLVPGSDAAAVLKHARKVPEEALPLFANPPTVGEGSYLAIKGAVAATQGVFKEFAEGLEEVRLARGVLKVETESQLRSLNDEVATLRAEYSQEIDATKDLAQRTMEAIARKRDDEIEIVASRLAEIKEMLLSDLMNLKKAQSAILREDGYLKKVAAASVASRLSPGSDMVKLLLGDHTSRLRTVKDEASKIQVLVDEIEKEKSRELSAIKDLYDELIMAKSRVVSDLQIELDVEVEKRSAEVNELTELQESLEKRFDGVAQSNEEYLRRLDWMVPDAFGLKGNTPFYVPVYVAISETSEKPVLACAPGVFFAGLPDMGAALTLEERLKPLSSYLRALAELHLSNKALKEREFLRKTTYLVRSKDILPGLPDLVQSGLRIAQGKGWVGDGRARDLEALAARPGVRAG